MTPVRAKRNSKAPNRFSSDNSRIETSNATGETIIDYNDNSTSTTHSLAPINRAIKLKPAMREPLKVKLPKLKRLHVLLSKEHDAKKDVGDIIIHKIKLPSLSSKKKSKNANNLNDHQIKTKSSSTDTDSANLKKNDANDSQASTASAMSSTPTINILSNPTSSQNDISKSSITTRLDISTTSKSSEEDKSFAANASIGSEDFCDESGMEIVVSKPETNNSSGIRCPCGVDDDLGVMVECESCSTWQHGHCINVGSEEEAYEGYTCAFCTLPKERIRDSLNQLTVGDTFQPHFNLLESLRKQNNNSEKEFSCTNNAAARLTTEELSQVLRNLRRVLNSLKVKWRLLTSPAYELELRIWRNPFWSDEPKINLNEDKNIYFMDRCKSNLKLNIRNMVKKMDDRCQLIDFAISLNEMNSESNIDVTRDSELKRLRKSLEEINQGVKEFKNKLKNLAD